MINQLNVVLCNTMDFKQFIRLDVEKSAYRMHILHVAARLSLINIPINELTINKMKNIYAEESNIIDDSDINETDIDWD